MLNIDTKIRTPYNELHIGMVYRSIDRKVFRDQFCTECGHPYMAISDKYIQIIDATIPTELLRDHERVIEARCKYHYCKQRFKIYP